MRPSQTLESQREKPIKSLDRELTASDSALHRGVIMGWVFRDVCWRRTQVQDPHKKTPGDKSNKSDS